MKKAIEKVLPVLEYICSLPPKEQLLHLKTLKLEALKIFLNVLLNVEKGLLPISAEIVEKLRPHKRVLLSIVSKSKSLKQRRVELLKRSVFEKLFCPLLPALRVLVEK